MHRVAAFAALVVGVGLIITTLALSLFGRAYAGERVADHFRQVMSPEGVVQQKAGLTLVGGMLKGYDAASATFARELHQTRPQYDRFVAANYPSVAAGVKEIPPAATNVVGPVVAQAPKIQGKWESVIHIPGLGLPFAGAPWLLVLAGVALAVAGIVGLVSPGRWVTAAILVLGLGMTVVPFALSLPQKTSDSKAVLKVGRVAVSQGAATAAHRTALTVDAMVGTLKANMLPDVARRLHVPLAELDATIVRDFPGLATALREWPAIAPAAFELTAGQQASVEDFKEVDGIGYGGLAWIAIGPGIVLLLLAGATLWTERRVRQQPA